ncbi:MAG TPA: F0F1 ATP synthase subunit B [Gemmatimonadales bacterium]|nr:F0F1 ATP synthase subunit B [Gemmatimonadales bacterium]
MLLLLALLQEAEAHGGPVSPFEVNFGLFFWTWLVFFGLLYVLKKFAWPPLLKATVEREKRIQELLDEAEARNKEAHALLEEHKRLVADSRSKAHAMIAEAKQVAEKERGVAMEKTRQEQEELLARARRDIATERERAIAELRREAVDLSLAAASKLIGERLTSETDRKLVEQYLANLSAGR